MKSSNKTKKKKTSYHLRAYHHSICNLVVNALNTYGLGAYVYHRALTGSIYVRFKNPNLRSLRIGDHDGREKYQYKFNLRSDLEKAGWKVENEKWRYYCPHNKWEWMVKEILKRWEIIKDWEIPQDYGNYEFKNFEEK